MQNDLSWPAQLTEALAVIRQPALLLSRLGDVPAMVSLKTLADLYRQHIAPHGSIPAAVGMIRELDRDTAHAALVKLKQAIINRLNGSDRDAGLIDPSDFGATGFLDLPADFTGPEKLTTGSIDSLPAGHFLRELDRSELVADGSLGPTLILGPADAGWGGGYVARPFYLLEDALRITGKLRAHQREQERIARERDERERRDAEDQARLNPELQAQRLDELAAENQKLKDQLAAMSS